jgi:hypothetical protein
MAARLSCVAAKPRNFFAVLEKFLGFGFAQGVGAGVGAGRAFAVLGDFHVDDCGAEFLADAPFFFFGVVAGGDAHATAAGFDGDYAREPKEALPPARGVIVERIFHGGVAALQSGARPVVGSIFVGHHDGDGGLWVVDVERAALRDEFYQLGAVVVVADVERDGDAV